MAEVIITKTLAEEINKTFKGESVRVFELIYTLRENPLKGKPVGNISRTVIKEIRYKSFRFYFIADGFKLKVLDEKELKNILIKFVRMSDKKSQQKVIDEIKVILRKIGEAGF
jgi:hypothetical protein